MKVSKKCYVAMESSINNKILILLNQITLQTAKNINRN